VGGIYNSGWHDDESEPISMWEKAATVCRFGSACVRVEVLGFRDWAFGFGVWGFNRLVEWG